MVVDQSNSERYVVECQIRGIWADEDCYKMVRLEVVYKHGQGPLSCYHDSVLIVPMKMVDELGVGDHITLELTT